MAATLKLDDVTAEKYGNGVRILSVKGDASYATGGYAVAGDFPLGADVVALNDLGAVIGEWSNANGKVKFITRASGAEVANASDQSAVTVKLLLPAA